MKDLPDLALLAQTGAFNSVELRRALERTFGFRKTRDLPDRLPSPPPSWATVYARMAQENTLPWPILDELELAARRFIDPVLSESGGTWNPASWTWTREIR